MMRLRFEYAIVGLVLTFATPITLHAQTIELPGIVVETGSPLPARLKRAAADETLPGPVIVADQTFFPTTLVLEDEIRARQSRTLGDVLFTKPGITSSTFAPLSSRPIIRGLDNFRVRIQENGIGTHDVSALSEDHGIPIDPLAAEKLEVVRGPATLRWGSQAIGGVVEASNNRIPDRVPAGFSVETSGAYTSVDEGGEGAVKIDAGAGNFAVHGDFFKRRGSDYEIPRGGRQDNTDYTSEGGAFGGSIVTSNGFMGVAIARFESDYGIPGEEAAERNLRIDLEQTKISSKGEYRPGGGAIAAVKYWFGYTDYKHDEISLDETTGETETGSTFINKEYEARSEVLHSAFNTGFGPLQGAIGLQLGHRDLSAAGEGGELLAPNNTATIAGYIFEELQATEKMKLQAAGRVEQVEVDGATAAFPVLNFMDEPGELFGVTRSFTPASGSLGLLYDLPAGVVVSLTGQYVERAPDALELLAKGPHEATETFEIGNPDLDEEKARTIEMGFRRASGSFRFDISAYYTVFDGFIFKSETGNFCEEGGGCDAADGLTQIVYAQQDATFYGAELAAELDIGRLWRGVWGIDGQYDIVKAEFSDGSSVPRITPQRLGGGLYYRDREIFARLGFLHAFRQDDVAELEEPTKGYNLLSAELNYSTTLPDFSYAREVTFGIKGENLLDDDVRNHVSFKKEDVLLPGQSIKIHTRLKLN